MVRTDGLPKHLLIGFIVALCGYVAFFAIDQHLRGRHGPWQVAFARDESGAPKIVIDQPRLGVTNVQVVFLGESVTNQPASVAFARPLQTIPFGKVKFEDLTYLPGSVALDLFGHEIELLPRTLYVNKQERPWRSGEVLRLQPGEKLAPEMSYDPRKKKRRWGR